MMLGSFVEEFDDEDDDDDDMPSPGTPITSPVSPADSFQAGGPSRIYPQDKH